VLRLPTLSLNLHFFCVKLRILGRKKNTTKNKEFAVLQEKMSNIRLAVAEPDAAYFSTATAAER